MNVYVSKIDQEGTILSISKDKKIGVQLALGKMFFDISDIEIKEKSNQKSKYIFSWLKLILKLDLSWLSSYEWEQKFNFIT